MITDLEGLKAFVFNHLIYAVLALLVGGLVARLARRWLRIILERSRVRDDSLLKDFFLRTLSLTIIGLATIAALSNLGFDVRSFLAGLGITGLILGFGLRDTLSNFAAGLLLLIYRPFRAGELIEVEGSQGVVEEMTIVNMEMTTGDGIRVIMPNSKVWGAKILNYSKAKRRRLELTVMVPLANVDASISAIKTAFVSDKRILNDPAPIVRASTLAAESARLAIAVWTEPDQLQSLTIDAYQKILGALKTISVSQIEASVTDNITPPTQ